MSLTCQVQNPFLVRLARLAKAGLFLLGLVTLAAPAVYGQAIIWTGASGTWATTTNWQGGVVPNSNTANAELNDTGTTTAVTLGSTGETIEQLTFDSTKTYTLAQTAASLTFGTGGANKILMQDTGSLDITAPIVLNGALTISDAGTSTLTLSGITGTAQNILISGPGTGAITLGGIIGTTSGTFTMSGAGTVTLGNTNTYTGINTFNSGIVDISTDLNLGAAPGSVTATSLTFAGGTLETTAGVTFATNRGITLNAGGGTIDVPTGVTSTYGGVMTGAGAFTKTDAGTLVLSGTNTNTGAVNINGGTLSIGAIANLGTAPGATTANNLNFNGGTLLATAGLTLPTMSGIGLDSGGGTFNVGSFTVNYGGIIAGPGALTLTGTTGTLNLSGVNTYTGATNIDAGTLIIGVANALSEGTAVTVANGATLTGTNSDAIGSLSGAGSVAMAAGKFLTTGYDNTNTTFSGAFTPGTTGGITKVGTGTFTLSGANLYTGATTVDSGTLVLDLASGSLAATSTLLMGGGNFTVFNNTGTKTQSLGATTMATNTFNQITVQGTSSTATTLTLSSLALTSAGSTLNINIANTPASVVFTTAPTMTNSINASVTVTNSAGTGFLSSTNGSPITLYGGAITMLATGTSATTNYSETASLALTAAESVNSLQISGTSGGTLSLPSHILTFTADGLLDTTSSGGFTITSSGTGSLNSSGLDLILHQFGVGTLTITSLINGGLAKGLIMDGTGTTYIDIANTYTGVTALNGGTLEVGSNTALGTGAAAVLSLGGAATIESDGTARTLANPLSINATGATITNSGTATALNFSGAVVNNGTNVLNLDNTAGTTFSGATFALSNAAADKLTFNTGSGATTTISGIISNGGGGASILAETGSGTLYLQGINTYTGGTLLTGGTLEVGNNAALGTGGALSLNGGTIESDGTARTLSIPVSITATGSTITNSGTATAMNFSGLVTNDGTYTLNLDNTAGTTLSAATALALSNTVTNQTLTLDTGSGATTTISGIISNGSSSGSVLAETGSGTLYLSGASANTYSGGTLLTGGTLEVGGATALGTGTLSLNGGTIESDATARTLSIPVSITATGSTITNSGTATALNFSGSMTNDGAYTLNLDNTAGSTFSAANSIYLSDSSSTPETLTLAVGNGATTTISGIIADDFSSGTSSGLTVTGTGTGTLILNGANTYKGGTTLTSGIAEVGNNAALGTGTISFNGGSIEGSGAFTLSNASSVAATGSIIGGSSALTFSGTMTNDGTNTLNLNNTGGTTFSNAAAINLSNSATNETLTLNTGSAAATTTISGVIANGGTSTASGLTVSGFGTIDLTAANTYAGATTVNGGTLSIGILNALSSSTDVTVATGATLSGTFSDTIGSLAGAGTASVVLTGGNLSMGNDNASTNFSGVISGSTILTKIGTGVFTLGGINTYTGITNIDGGTLAISADSGLGTAPGAVVANQLTFDGGTLEITGAGFTLNSKRGITLYSSGGNIDVASGATLTYAGIMTGGNPFTKSDAGTLILSGVNTNTGTTTINGGTLSIGADTGLGTAPGSVTANDLNFSNDGTLNASASFTLNSNRGITLNTGGGTIDVSSGATLTYGGILAGAGSNAFTKTDSGTLILSGVNTFSGATNINGGTLSIAADSGLGTAPGSVTANDLNFGGGTLNTSASFTLNSNRGVTLNTGGGTFDENSGTTLTYGGIIAGASSANALTKADTGTLILTGANTFIGAVNVNGGTLTVQNSAGLGAGTAGTTVASGATLELDTGVTVDNGVLTISGTGAGGNGALLNGSGANTWNDNISLGASATINSGTSANSLLQLGPATSVDTVALGTNTLTFTGGANTSTLEESTITGTGATGVIVNTSGNVHYFSNENTYTGTTSIVSGTLIVDTGNSETPRNTNVGIVGSIIVGDGTGAPGSALLQMAELGAATRSDDEALSANLTMTVNSDGQVNLNNQHESIGTLILTGGNVDTQSSGGQNGLYLNNASVVVNANPITAGISGVLNLEPLNSTGAPVNFNVTAGGNVTSDLTIPAELQDGSFIKSGNGTMVLQGNNYQFQGTAEVQAGTLNIQSHNALGTSVGATTVDSGGQLQLSNGAGAGLTFDAEALTISGNGTFGVAQTQSTPGALYNIEGNNTWTGSISTLASATIYNNTNSNLTITGAISPTSGSNTLTLAGPATTTISGAISGGLSLVKNGTGTLVLNGATNNSFTGSVVINAGSVILSAPTGTNAISGSGITINSGGTLLNAASNQFAPNVPMTLNGGTWNVQGYSEGVTASLGSGSVGTLTLSATSSLELGTPVGANSIVHFANSTGTQGSWSGTLDIIGWTGLSTNPEAGGGPDQVLFGTTGSVGLTMSGGQIADIEFININPGHGYGIGNYDATILSDGEIVPFLPVPEPATTAAGAALVVLAGLAEWRRRRARLT